MFQIALEGLRLPASQVLMLVIGRLPRGGVGQGMVTLLLLGLRSITDCRLHLVTALLGWWPSAPYRHTAATKGAETPAHEGQGRRHNVAALSPDRSNPSRVDLQVKPKCEQLARESQ